jgi:hypothetical protein
MNLYHFWDPTWICTRHTCERLGEDGLNLVLYGLSLTFGSHFLFDLEINLLVELFLRLFDVSC